MKLVKILWFIPLLLLTVSSIVQADLKEIQLGTINGQEKNGNQVEILRELPDNTLFSSYGEPTAKKIDYLIIRSSRMTGGGEKTFVHSGYQTESKRVTVNTIFSPSLWVNGKKVAMNYENNGHDVVITLPSDASQVELKNEGMVRIFIPDSYRGELSIPLEIEGWSQS